MHMNNSNNDRDFPILMMHSFGYSELVLTSSHPGKMPLKMQTTVSRENSTISQRKKECSKAVVGDTSPFVLLKVGWFPI